jgi:citrate lyase beta subunit
VRHYGFLDPQEQDRLFLRPPEPFSAGSDAALLGVGLGATLYCPATRPRLADDIVRRAATGATSVVVCLEDSVPDRDLAGAEQNAIVQLQRLAAAPPAGQELPLVFVRVRSAAQIAMVIAQLGGAADIVTGFVVPKFAEDTGATFFEATVAAAGRIGRRLLVMPVLEHPEIARLESRLDALLAARRLIDKYRDLVPAVRVGATDLSGGYGLRRPREFTVWDVRVVADVLADVVNVFGREESGNYVVTGPVWEYFPTPERVFKPLLREAPFIDHDERTLRAELLARDLDGLIREVLLDRANGLLGKTVIHPSHVAAVHALSVVTAEEFRDVEDVLASAGAGGAMASRAGNKMNESRPHSAWARRTLQRARMFGVAREGVTFVDLLAAGLRL